MGRRVFFIRQYSDGGALSRQANWIYLEKSVTVPAPAALARQNRTIQKEIEIERSRNHETYHTHFADGCLPDRNRDASDNGLPRPPPPPTAHPGRTLPDTTTQADHHPGNPATTAKNREKGGCGEYPTALPPARQTTAEKSGHKKKDGEKSSHS
jgi:hypothetical protein